jgi:hypothetical protein
MGFSVDFPEGNADKLPIQNSHIELGLCFCMSIFTVGMCQLKKFIRVYYKYILLCLRGKAYTFCCRGQSIQYQILYIYLFIFFGFSYFFLALFKRNKRDDTIQQYYCYSTSQNFQRRKDERQRKNMSQRNTHIFLCCAFSLLLMAYSLQKQHNHFECMCVCVCVREREREREGPPYSGYFFFLAPQANPLFRSEIHQ